MMPPTPGSKMPPPAAPTPPSGGEPMPNKAAQAHAAAVQSKTPMAEEPLPAGLVKAFADAVADAARTASGGQVDLPEFPLKSTDPDMQQIPPPVYQAAETISRFLKSAAPKIPMLAQYVFDCDAAASTVEGLRDATAKLRAMSQDKGVVAALSSPTPPPEKAQSGGSLPASGPKPEVGGGVGDFVKASPPKKK